MIKGECEYDRSTARKHRGVGGVTHCLALMWLRKVAFCANPLPQCSHVNGLRLESARLIALKAAETHRLSALFSGVASLRCCPIACSSWLRDVLQCVPQALHRLLLSNFGVSSTLSTVCAYGHEWRVLRPKKEIPSSLTTLFCVAHLEAIVVGGRVQRTG